MPTRRIFSDTALLRYLKISGRTTQVERVLLSADNIPNVLIRELNAQGIEVYSHFGMTETGYGCAIDCDAHVGMHIREPDLLIEIIAPETGDPLPDGQFGEVVLTTLTRRGMSLIRYRTGDFSRIIPGDCPCGSRLRRLDNIRGRIHGGVLLSGRPLTMPQLDEALFALPQVMDFHITVKGNQLLAEISAFSNLPLLREETVCAALRSIPSVRDASVLQINVSICAYEDYHPLHRNKRTLLNVQY